MNKQNIANVHINQELLNINNTAKILGVSTTTVHKWVKAGALPLHSSNSPYVFDKKDIEKVKSKLLTGQFAKLKKRANKTKSKKIFVPEEYTNNKKDQAVLYPILFFIQKNNIDISKALFLLSLNFLKKQKILKKNDLKTFIQGGKNTQCSNKQIKKEISTWFSEINTNNLLYRSHLNIPYVELNEPRHFDMQATKKHVLGLDRGSYTLGIKNFSFLLDCALPETTDCLGIIYQSLLFEGKKSENGSYYTPANIVHDIGQEYVTKDSKILDPCCGTGQFLLAFSDMIQEPLNIYGMDRDPIAVKIARLNILSKFKDKNFIPNIFLKDALSDIENYSLFHSAGDKSANNFNIIATNPPWGARFSREEKVTLRNIYPEISSFESFAYFIAKSLNQLCNQGIASFILPESILNVKAHKDIREIILRKSEVIKIIRLGRIFTNVFTPVIRLDLRKLDFEKGLIAKGRGSHRLVLEGFSTYREDKAQETYALDLDREANKTSKKTNQVFIQNKNKKYKINQIRWACNLDFIFDIDMSPFDFNIIKKIYNTNHTTLENKADWALGIVTGNNKQFIANNKKLGYEPIYRGKDVQKFILSKPSCYIRLQPDKFQQIAEVEKYRMPEKLIYRFISKKLIFAYDDQKRLTLNSANIVIPRVEDYPIKIILSLFNSSVYQFISQKKFFSLKVLRNHIEAMPLPLWDQQTFSSIINMANELLQGQGCFKELDNYIMNQFSLSEKEKQYIRANVIKS